MLGHMTQDQREKMKQELIVPLAVSDILLHDIKVEPDMQYGMHMALSEVDPDSALLAIALCAQDLAQKVKNQAPIAMALETEATEIFHHYGQQWLRNNLNAPISSALYADILDTVPEDLEALADLLDALQSDLDNETLSISKLAKLLSIQARAHMEIADFVLAEISYEKYNNRENEDRPDFGYQTEPAPKIEATERFAGDNILDFPGTQN